MEIAKWRDLPLFNNSLTAWLVAGATFAVLFAVLLFMRVFIRRYASRYRATARTEILEIPLLVLSRTTFIFFFVVSMCVGARALELGQPMQRMLDSLFTIACFWQLGVWIAAAIGVWIDRRRQHTLTENRAAAGSLGIIRFIANTLIWALVLLATLDNLGINITALVAGLGIGGVAVALALQNVLGDLFASLAIALDRPFVIGDFLEIDAFLGSVENIGIKTTRLRSLNGEQIIMSNSNLLSSRVRNFGRMTERRVAFGTSVGYETPVELVERIPALLRDIVKAQKDVRFDRSHFQKHGVSSLDFETVYYVTTPDFNRYMDIQQAINFALHRKFLELAVPFASATQKQLGELRPAAPQPPPAEAVVGQAQGR